MGKERELFLSLLYPDVYEESFLRPAPQYLNVTAPRVPNAGIPVPTVIVEEIDGNRTRGARHLPGQVLPESVSKDRKVPVPGTRRRVRRRRGSVLILPALPVRDWNQVPVHSLDMGDYQRPVDRYGSASG